MSPVVFPAWLNQEREARTVSIGIGSLAASGGKKGFSRVAPQLAEVAAARTMPDEFLQRIRRSIASISLRRV
jgi:hypothetical protein